MLLTAAGSAVAASAANPLELLSRSAFGTLGNGMSGDPAISADGRLVAFTSDASNLVDNDPVSWYWKTDPDVFILDRESGSVENASRTLNGEGFWFLKTICQKPTLDGAGASAAFECYSGYHSAHRMQFDIYLYERSSGSMRLVSQRPDGLRANGGSSDPVLSGDGSTLAFTTKAYNLLAADPDALADIYLYDPASGSLALGSLGADGSKGNGASGEAALSGDGRYLAFTSTANNLVAGDDNGVADIFLRDRSSGGVLRFAAPDNAPCAEPALSGDGSLLVFSAPSAAGSRIYLARVGAPPAPVASGSAPTLSADGRFLAYLAAVPGAPSGVTGIYRLDLASGQSELASVTAQGAAGNGVASAPALSAHGAELVFASTAADLVAGDDNGVADVFLASAPADTTPPIVALQLSRGLLWPPNHKFVPVQVDGLAEDDRELAAVEITLSDEYGSAINQVVPGFGSTIWLEAWRDGDDLDGRHYTISVVAVDAAGNRSETSADVVVPHDMRGK